MRNLSIIAGILFTTLVAGAKQLETHIVAAQEYQKRGDLIRAEQEIQVAVKETFDHGAETFEAARALALLGVFYQDIGRFPDAEFCFLRALKILKGITGPQDESQPALVSRLAFLYVETGRTGKAKGLHLNEYWVPLLTKSRSKYLPSILESVSGLYELQGNFTSAEQIFRRETELLTERSGKVSFDMASALNNFGFIQLKAGHYDNALDSFTKALQEWARLSGVDDLQVAMTRLGMAETFAHLGRYQESSELFGKALPVFEERCGPRSLRTADVLINYAKLLRVQKQNAQARNFEARAHRIRDEIGNQAWSRNSIDVRVLR